MREDADSLARLIYAANARATWLAEEASLYDLELRCVTERIQVTLLGQSRGSLDRSVERGGSDGT